MNIQMNELYDLAVVGGGPAGTTVAALMAGKGHRVVLLEKDTHPRFHIGESLLPMNLEIFDELGIPDKIAQIGVKKLGADFTCENRAGVYQTFLFSRGLGNNPGYAFEVRRAEFDQLLFENARSKGAQCLEATRVTSVERLPEGTFCLHANDQRGKALSLHARYVVDASGRDCLLSSRNDWKVKNPRHASAALFGHFRNVPRRPGDNQGNISIYWFKHGWIWMIPLQGDLMSVGAVASPEYLKTRQTDPAQFLMQTIATCRDAQLRMRNAESVGEIRATGNYSYLSTEIGEDGYLLIGDAYAFVDPVFSSGVYLAMSSAMRAQAPIEAWLAGSKDEYRRLKKQHRRQVDKAIRTFSWFIYRFTSPAMRKLFNDPRDVLGVERGVISMLAGDVYSNPAVLRRLQVFKLIYAIAWLLDKLGVNATPRRHGRGRRISPNH